MHTVTVLASTENRVPESSAEGLRVAGRRRELLLTSESIRKGVFIRGFLFMFSSLYPVLFVH